MNERKLSLGAIIVGIILIASAGTLHARRINAFGLGTGATTQDAGAIRITDYPETMERGVWHRVNFRVKLNDPSEWLNRSLDREKVYVKADIDWNFSPTLDKIVDIAPPKTNYGEWISGSLLIRTADCPKDTVHLTLRAEDTRARKDLGHSRQVAIDLKPHPKPAYNVRAMVDNLAPSPGHSPGSVVMNGREFVSGGEEFESGTTVKLVAEPYNGWIFDHWEKWPYGTVDQLKGSYPSGYGESPWKTDETIEFEVDSEMDIVAFFKKNPDAYRLTVEEVGKGDVAWHPKTYYPKAEPIDKMFNPGKVVYLSVHSSPGWEFDHWSGDASGSQTPLKLVMDEDKHIKAHFSRKEPEKTYHLTIEVKSGKGVVTPKSGTWNSGDEITLHARPAEGWNFDHWSGDVSGSEALKTITLNSDMEAYANFVREEPEEVTLQLLSSPPEGGSVGHAQSKSVTVEKGAVVSVQAYPNQGWNFSHWSGDASGDSKATKVVMDGDKTAVANFTKEKTPVEKAASEAKDNAPLILGSLGSILLIGGAVSRFGLV